jgi:hypothetical protein
MPSLAHARFDRSKVPPPEVFFRTNVKKFRARGRKATGLCSFHEDHRPSLSMDLDRGLFHCFACGASGDIVTFVMRRDGVDFKTAAQSLGAWNDGELSRATRRELDRTKQRRERIAQEAVDLAEREHCLRLDYRKKIHAFERVVREMRSRLQELKPDHIDTQDYQTSGAVLSAALDALREALTGYFILAFGMTAQRADFVLHPENRDRTIAAVIQRGFVHDDSGHLTEVMFP